MTAEKLVIDKKYKPLKKSVGCDLLESVEWKTAIRKNQNFLYFVGEQDGEYLFASEIGKKDSDIFAPEDVILFHSEENKNITLLNSIPNMIAAIQQIKIAQYNIEEVARTNSGLPMGKNFKVYLDKIEYIFKDILSATFFSSESSGFLRKEIEGDILVLPSFDTKYNILNEEDRAKVENLIDRCINNKENFYVLDESEIIERIGIDNFNKLVDGFEK